MDWPNLQMLLAQVTEQTFEALSFMLPADEVAADAAAEEHVTASVGFTGPCAGHVCLTAPASLLAPLAEGMLGSAAGAPNEEQQQDALGEVLNVICGHLLPLMGGREAVFRVAAPQVPAADATEPVAAEMTMAFDEGPVRVRLSLRREPAALEATP
jgi:chemotaxis protein CheY-P-specific phosphatase CheC